jgi:stage II sporulation protein M
MVSYYKEQYKYFRETYLKPLLFVLVMFFALNTVTYMGLVNSPDEVAEAKKRIVNLVGGVEKLKEVKKTEHTTLLYYLKNNISMSIILFLVGMIPFYLISFFIFSPNTLLLGFVMAISEIERDSPFTDAIITIGPHGITEFISIFTTAAISFHLSHTVTRKIVSKNRKAISVQSKFLKGIQFFLTVCIPLMIISGFIEAYITPIIIRHFS